MSNVINPPDDLETERGSVYRDSTDSMRDHTNPFTVMKPSRRPKLLLVDDDPSFGKLMHRVAEKYGVSLTYCRTMDDLGGLGGYNYDVAIIDYDLGAVTGFELTSYLEKYTPQEMPVILVSQTQQESSKEWPTTIREFVHKSNGPFAILDAAFEAHEVTQIYNHMRGKKN